ncbi:MAG: HIT family protein [Gammaproteobacteria bacterium]|jgi:diadenosine tetraphosphate (Ap4A) HIT family hydrolase
MNATIEKFGYPATLVSEYEHWVVLLRPQQATLGALILAARDEAEAFGDLPVAAVTELSRVTRDIESTLSQAFAYDKINYLMLMMVDPHVHFHVLPRYASARNYRECAFQDAGWPGPPHLGEHAAPSETVFDAIRLDLLEAWPEVGR